MKTLHHRASKLCNKLFKLERQGRYEEALFEIGDLWQDRSELPDVDGLPQPIAAELILRCGSLFGFLGHNKQIPNSQEKSRNLVSAARDRFTQLYNIEKIAECENYLALTYWRKGEVNEAEAWLDESFSHNLPLENNARIYSYIIKGLVSFSEQKYAEILNLFQPIEQAVQKSSDNCLKGAYYSLVGNSRENLGHIPNALKALETAKDFYQKARHQVYYGAILNDLAYLWKSIKNYEKAHIMIDDASTTFKKIKDRSHEGYSLDTKARIYQSEGNLEAALKTIEKAIDILRLGENSTYLIESLATKIKILISSDEISTATFCLMEAVDIAKTNVNEDAAKALVANYEIWLRQHLQSVKPGVDETHSVDEDDSNRLSNPENTPIFNNLELVLPSSLSKYEDIQGIWIHNQHLEHTGLVKDSLAVVASTEKVNRGDLIAIEEIETQNVSCGFYDNEFGIVCLERHDSDPLLFDEERISIIGKIVGVASKRTPDGKLIVEPISI